jgi:hypothetical protein
MVEDRAGSGVEKGNYRSTDGWILAMIKYGFRETASTFHYWSTYRLDETSVIRQDKVKERMGYRRFGTAWLSVCNSAASD